MPGSVLVPSIQQCDVFIDQKQCGTTNVPFDVEIGTHDIDLGAPPSQRITVLPSHTPLNPLVVEFNEPLQASSAASSPEPSAESHAEASADAESPAEVTPEPSQEPPQEPSQEPS
jgi:hypothetical protein